MKFLVNRVQGNSIWPESVNCEVIINDDLVPSVGTNGYCEGNFMLNALASPWCASFTIAEIDSEGYTA